MAVPFDNHSYNAKYIEAILTSGVKIEDIPIEDYVRCKGDGHSIAHTLASMGKVIEDPQHRMLSDINGVRVCHLMMYAGHMDFTEDERATYLYQQGMIDSPTMCHILVKRGFRGITRREWRLYTKRTRWTVAHEAAKNKFFTIPPDMRRLKTTNGISVLHVMAMNGYDNFTKSELYVKDGNGKHVSDYVKTYKSKQL